MRKTIQDKYNEIRLQAVEKEFEFVVNSLGEIMDDIPDEIYHVTYRGEVEIHEVETIGIRHPTCFYTKKPTIADMKMLNEHLESDWEKEEILFRWKMRRQGGTAMGATALSDLLKERQDFISHEKAEVRAKEIKTQREHENELIAQGHVRCDYCGKVRAPEDIIRKSIWRNHRKTKPLPYCKEGCAGYAQMGAEG